MKHFTLGPLLDPLILTIDKNAHTQWLLSMLTKLEISYQRDVFLGIFTKICKDPFKISKPIKCIM